jgi:hypothetical protein
MEQVFFDQVGSDGYKSVAGLTNRQRLYLAGILNSFAFDWVIRKSITAHVSFFFVYNVPVPRLADDHPRMSSIVGRAARLSCISSEFDELAKAVGMRSYKNGTTDSATRAMLRAELDALIAHLYGLSEKEFTEILRTFPLVPEPVKQATLKAFRDVEQGLIQ